MIDERADSDWANLKAVAPFTGAWIEIGICLVEYLNPFLVAPFMGAWIEIIVVMGGTNNKHVAPFTGAWIEISCVTSTKVSVRKSHPSRVRGLKLRV